MTELMTVLTSLTLVAKLSLPMIVLALWWLGRTLRRDRLGEKAYDVKRLSYHKRAVSVFFCLLALALAVIDTQVRSSLNVSAVSLALFWFHIVIDIAFLLVSGVMIFWLTGIRNRRWHRKLAYLNIPLFATSYATGLWMAYQLSI